MEKTYLPHQQRVVDEKVELDIKLKALDKFVGERGFVFKSLHADEQQRLLDQAEIMLAYSRVLGERIAAF